MSDWKDRWLTQEYIRNRLHEAEQWHLAQQALAGKRQTDPLHHRVLRWLGHRLIAWGSQLKERYSKPCPIRLNTEGVGQ
jgi:hypothetical protein